MIAKLLVTTAAFLLLAPLCGPLIAAEEKAPEASPASATVIDPNDAAAARTHLGNRVTLEGTLVKASESKSKTVRYLNFSTNFRNSVSLVFFTSGGSGADFTMERLQEYVGKKVRATGILSEHENALQVKIDSLSQLEVVQ